MNINKKMPYTRPDVSVRHIEVEGMLLVESFYGKKVVDGSKVQSVGQEVTTEDNTFKFTWE